MLKLNLFNSFEVFKKVGQTIQDSHHQHSLFISQAHKFLQSKNPSLLGIRVWKNLLELSRKMIPPYFLTMKRISFARKEMVVLQTNRCGVSALVTRIDHKVIEMGFRFWKKPQNFKILRKEYKKYWNKSYALQRKENLWEGFFLSQLKMNFRKT